MKVEVQIHPTRTTAHEAAQVELHVRERRDPYVLDLDVTSLLRNSRDIDPLAFDFLFVASTIYAIDKAAPRKPAADAEDRWTRQLGVSIPVADATRWRRVAREFSECVSFLTGDIWEIRFETATRDVVQRRARRTVPKTKRVVGAAASLFSGGLDSYIGAIDWLEENKAEALCLVGHYDGHVAGPKSDQQHAFAVLQRLYPSRVSLIQTRVGIRPGGKEKTFRSRSLLFIALGYFAASRLGADVPVIIPENGPIALNCPLNASRRGSCSTRTAHPKYLSSLASTLRRLGFQRALANPYELRTKGEMVANCRNQTALRAGALQTVSCAKSGHVVHWDDKSAQACGRCVPCLFRRAALHTAGMDTESYGIDVCSTTRTRRGKDKDLLPLLSFIRRQMTAEDVARALVCNGAAPSDRLREYSDVVMRMRSELRAWLSAKAPRNVRVAAGIP